MPDGISQIALAISLHYTENILPNNGCKTLDEVWKGNQATWEVFLQ